METDKRLRITRSPDGDVVQFDNRRLNAARPREGMRRRFPSPADNTAYIFFSPLQGYGASDFRAALPANSAAFFFEFEHHLRPVYEGADCEVAGEVILGDISDLRRRVRSDIRNRGIRRLAFPRLSAGISLHRTRYGEIETVLLEDLRQVWMNRATEITLGRRWLGNLFSNIALSGRHVYEAAPAVGAHAVIIGAGPSLDRSLPRLRPALMASEDRPTVIAIDTALPVLAELGLRPDFIAAMDGQHHNVRDFVPWRWDDVSLIADLTCHPSILRKFPPERRFVYLSEFAPLTIVDELGEGGVPVIPPLGSVAGATLRVLATHLSTRLESVTLAGLDFSFPVARTHARMAPSHRRALAMATRRRSVSMVDSEFSVPAHPLDAYPKLWTTAALESQAALVREEIQLMREEGIAVHSLEEGIDIGAERLDIVPTAFPPSAGGGFGDPEGESFATIGNAVFLSRWIERLQSAEARVSEGSPVNDPGVHEAATLDFPDAARLATDREFRGGQSGRILQSLKDLRRRASRAARTISPMSPS